MLTIGERLIQIRKSLGLSQKDFAAQLGIMPQALTRNEKDTVKPSADLLIKLTENNNVNISWLLTGNGEMFLDQREEPKILEKCDEVREAFLKLPAERQKYYYHTIIAESLK